MDMLVNWMLISKIPHVHCYFIFADYSIDSVGISASPASPNLVVESTGMVDFTCSVNVSCNGTCDNTTIMVAWTKDGTVVFTNTSVEITSSPSVFVVTASINGDIVVSDAGSYQCQAELPPLSPVISVPAKTLTVTSKQAPSIIICEICAEQYF